MEACTSARTQTTQLHASQACGNASVGRHKKKGTLCQGTSYEKNGARVRKCYQGYKYEPDGDDDMVSKGIDVKSVETPTLVVE